MSRDPASVLTAERTPLLQWRRFTLAASLLRAFARRPGDCIGIVVIVATAGAIVANALYLQNARHPAPIVPRPVQPSVAPETTGSLIVIPRPRPPELEAAQKDAGAPARPRAQIVGDIQRELARRGFYEGAMDGVYGPKMDAAIRDFEQAAGLKPTGEPSEALLQAIARSSLKATTQRPPASIPAAASQARRPDSAAASPVTSTRVAAVQRALTDFGYGQLQPTGVFDNATKTAIEKFERERKLPISGQISERVTRELAAVTGRPLE